MNAARTPKRADAPRVWTFDSADYSVPIPENIPVRSQSNYLPFKQWFEAQAPHALAGKQPHLFLPHAYWIEARQADPEKVTDSYARGKVRDQFKAWQKSTGISEAAKLSLVVLPRSGAEDIKGIDEPGLSFWLTKAT